VDKAILDTARQEMLQRLKEKGDRHGYPVLFYFIGKQLGADGVTGASGTTLEHICHNVKKDDRPQGMRNLKAFLIEAGLNIAKDLKYGQMVLDASYLDVTRSNATAC